MSKKSEIEDYLSKNPTSVQKDLVRNFPEYDYDYMAKVMSEYKNGKSTKKKKKRKKGKNSKKVKKIIPEHILDPKIFEALPPKVQKLMALAPAMKNVPAWLGPIIIAEIMKGNMNPTPPWTRPPILHPIQNEIIDTILYKPKIKVIMVDGEKRLGKSWMGWIAWCEAQYNNNGYLRWFLYGATEQNASFILKSLKTEPLLVDYTTKILDGMGSAMRVTSYIQGFLQVMASGSERATSGTDSDVVWVDESHSVLIENPKTIAMSAMVLRARKNLKILYTMNREGEAYEYFKNEMLENFPPEEIAYFSLTKENCPHIIEETDKAVRTIVRASAGEDYEKMYLDNEYRRTGGLYYPSAKITKAYHPVDKPKLEQYDVIGCGIDWGDSHDLAFCIAGFQVQVDGLHKCYQEEMIYMQHPTNTEIERIIVRLIREYPGIIFVWENSPLGTYVRNSIRQDYPNTRFIDSGFSKWKQKYIDNIYIWLVDEDIYLIDGKLKRQLRSYVNDKKNDDGHDALAHLLYKIVPARTTMKIEVKVIMRD